MTYEEVNRIFRTKFLGTCCIDLENDDGIYECESPTLTCEKCRIAEAERMILDAIERQIPEQIRSIYSGRYYRCPVCNEQVAKKQNYCEFCGQRLKEVEDDK